MGILDAARATFLAERPAGGRPARTTYFSGGAVK